MVAQISKATLCALALEPERYTYGSFVTVAFENAGPIFLISGLAEHTKNLGRDSRASLLMAEGGSADPLANGRFTMLGPCTRVGEDGGRPRAAFFVAHPSATYYADFRDMTFWKLHVDNVGYIGGYGRMSWISQADWRAAEPDPRAPSAADIIAHMNADHADALLLYCKALFPWDRDHLRENDGRRQIWFRNVGDNSKRTTTPPFGVRLSGQHAGGSPRRSDLLSEGRQVQAGQGSTVGAAHADRDSVF